MLDVVTRPAVAVVSGTAGLTPRYPTIDPDATTELFIVHVQLEGSTAVTACLKMAVVAPPDVVADVTCSQPVGSVNVEDPVRVTIEAIN